MPTNWMAGFIATGNLVPVLVMLLMLWFVPALLFYPVLVLANGLAFVIIRELVKEYEVLLNRRAVVAVLVGGNLAAILPFVVIAMYMTPETAWALWTAPFWTVFIDWGVWHGTRIVNR